MLTVDSMYRICQYAINKDQNGYLTPSEFNLLVEQAQQSFMDYLLGEFQQYQYGRAQARIQYSANSVVRQRLSPLIYGYNLPIDTTGFSSYPGDYVQTDAMWSLYGVSRYRYVQQDTLFSYYNSKIDPIANNPIYLIEDEGFRFYPQNLSSARLTYVRKPTRIYWNYTLDANGEPVYNAATSEQPVWNDVDILEIIVRMLRIVGLNLQLGDVSQYSETIKNQGQ